MSGLLETYSNYSTKFSSPMACYVHDYVMGNGDNGDEDWSNPNSGEGAARFGRRILTWRSDGFINLITYDDEQEATDAFAWDQCDHGCHAWGEPQVSRLAGTPHRVCERPDCSVITLDLTDEDEDY